jgi:hypothetical protein
MSPRLKVLIFLLGCVLVAAVGCGGGSGAKQSSNSNNATPGQAPSGGNSNASASPTPSTNTGNPSSSGKSGGVAWWPSDLALPAGSALDFEIPGTSATTRSAMWTAKGTSPDVANAFMVKEASGAGYTVWNGYSGVTSAVGGFHLYFLKGTQVYHLEIDASPTEEGAASLNGTTPGMMHVKTSGAASLELDLPVTNSSIDSQYHTFTIETNVLKPGCDSCVYLFDLNLGQGSADYTGPGIYTNVMGAANPGFNFGPLFGGNSCSMTVNDQVSGTFQCQFAGLESATPYPPLNVSGSWLLPSK